MIRITLALVFIVSVYHCGAQHIQYRDKRKPVAVKSEGGDIKEEIPIPDRTVKTYPPDTSRPVAVVKPEPEIPKRKIDTVVKPVVIAKDTSASLKMSKAAFVMNPKPRKPWVEEQNMCNLLSRPELAPQLPLVINNVKPEMVKLLKERYKGRLYSITGLNMIDERLKFKLKICDKDNAKFRSEYLDKDGNVVKDPGLYYD